MRHPRATSCKWAVSAIATASMQTIPANSSSTPDASPVRNGRVRVRRHSVSLTLKSIGGLSPEFLT
jgi:hypothetical protein